MKKKFVTTKGKLSRSKKSSKSTTATKRKKVANAIEGGRRSKLKVKRPKISQNKIVDMDDASISDRLQYPLIIQVVFKLVVNMFVLSLKYISFTYLLVITFVTI